MIRQHTIEVTDGIQMETPVVESPRPLPRYRRLGLEAALLKVAEKNMSRREILQSINEACQDTGELIELWMTRLSDDELDAELQSWS